MRTGRRDWLWVVAIIAVVFVGIAAGFALLSGGSSSKVIATVDGVHCESGERLDYHVHTHLTLIEEGQEIPVPGDIGIQPDCLFWLHTHSDNGIIHVEAPEQRDFTLGQLFAVWGQPLSETRLLDRTADASHEIQATVNGQTWEGDPAGIPLDDQTSVVIQYGPPFVPPPQYTW
jgi:hypothetical protein